MYSLLSEGAKVHKWGHIVGAEAEVVGVVPVEDDEDARLVSLRGFGGHFFERFEPVDGAPGESGVAI